MMGSGVFTGVFDLDEILGKPDNFGAAKFGEELRRIGFAGEKPVGAHPVKAYFEAHIEQGPILEDEGKTIGVVTGAQGQRWYEIKVIGQEAHAGPTPMKKRRDALVGAARMIDAVNRIGHAHPPNACATVGSVQVSPNSRNTIPGRVFFTVDFRHPVDATLSAMDDELKRACREIAKAAQVEVEITDFWYFPPTPFEKRLVDRVRDAAEAQRLPHRDIVSGAGHDAVYMARVAPTAMVFVPCKDGISHHPAEDASPDDAALAAEIILNAIQALI
jgi:N-carbamoyl-L-amino-acid hydrolase